MITVLRPNRLLGVAIALLLAASACSQPSTGDDGNGDASGGATTTLATDATGEGSESTTTAGELVDQVGYLTDLIDDSYAAGGMAIRGWIMAVDSRAAKVRVADVVGDWSEGQAAAFDQTTELPLGRDWLQAALTSALADGEIPALLLTAEEGLVAVAVLTDDLRSFLRDSGRDLPAQIRIGAWVGAVIDGGGLEVEVVAPIDPTRDLSCQDSSQDQVVSYAEVDGDEVVGAIRFAEAVLADEAARAQARELRDLATEIAASHTTLDPLTDTYTAPWSSDILDQLTRGVSPDQVELIPTLPFFLDPGRLDWLKPGGEVVLFADTATNRLLSWIDFYGYLDGTHEAETGWLEVMVPPEGDLGVYLGPMEGSFRCTENLPEPYIVIPRADVIAKRWIISLDSGQAIEWHGQTDG
jgi:hypothetical protein